MPFKSAMAESRSLWALQEVAAIPDEGSTGSNVDGVETPTPCLLSLCLMATFLPTPETVKSLGKLQLNVHDSPQVPEGSRKGLGDLNVCAMT